jgi:hypothetical protein
MSRWDDFHLVMKVIVYRAFIVVGILSSHSTFAVISQVSLVGPILRFSVPAFTQVGRLLNRFDVHICGDRFDQKYLYEFSG